MDSFSISQLSQFSGIKPHTIRIWEQRYKALKPNRSDGNTRYYDSSQLRRLLNIVSLIDSEHKVSELCSMPDTALFKLLEGRYTQQEGDQTEYLISQLILAGIGYDETHFDKIFSHCLLRYGMKDCYTRILYPMLVRVGLMWTSDNIAAAREHFITNCVRKKLFTAIDSLPPPVKGARSWLLFLPENEFHELGLLLACYLIRLSGENAVYIGGNLPFQSLAGAIEEVRPDCLLLFLVHHDLSDTVSKYLEELSRLFSREIFLAASEVQTKGLKKIDRLHYLFSADDLTEQLPVINV